MYGRYGALLLCIMDAPYPVSLGTTRYTADTADTALILTSVYSIPRARMHRDTLQNGV